MPINAFGGGPGSGKTYGVMEHVILPAIAEGRFILTNIEGLKAQAIYDYTVANAPKGKIICIGHIRTCDRSAPDDDEFFPGDEALDKPSPVPSPDYSRVAPGDLVVMDEATRHWAQGEKIKRGHAFFFREHRHFTNVMGQSCDMVVIDPDLTLIARQLRGKFEMASVTHKPKELGMNKYVVNIYPRGRVSGKPTQTRGPYSFREEIYSLYKSYSHDKAKEQSIDGRQSLFSDKRFLYKIVFMLIAAVFAVWKLWHFFDDKINPGAKAGTTITQDASAPGAASPKSEYSADWRIVGVLDVGGVRQVVLAGTNGIRMDEAIYYKGAGLSMTGRLDGKKVTRFSGPAFSPSLADGKKDGLAR